MPVRWLVSLAVLAAVVGAISASGAGIQVNGGTLQVFVIPVDLRPVQAAVDIKPESLQKRSQGENVEAHISLPSGFDINHIDPQSIRLCRGSNCIAAVTGRVRDRRFVAVFDRGAVLGLVRDVTPPEVVTFTVKGVVQPPGKPFEGSDTVRVVDPEPTPTPTPTSTVTPTSRATPTPVPTQTPTSTPTATPTGTPVPTNTPTPAPTGTPPTQVPTPTPTAGPAAPTPTAVPSRTPSPAPTAGQTPTPTPRAGQTPSPTPTAAGTAAPSPSPVPTATR